MGWVDALLAKILFMLLPLLKKFAVKVSFKVGIPPYKKIYLLCFFLRFICFTESPLKMMKNALYFILKALSVLKICQVLS